MGKRYLVRVQEHPFERAARVVGLEQDAVKREIAVLIVAEDRKARRCEVNADLVGTPGLQFSFQQGKLGILAQQGKHRVRFHAAGLHHHAPLAIGGRVFM